MNIRSWFCKHLYRTHNKTTLICTNCGLIAFIPCSHEYQEVEAIRYDSNRYQEVEYTFYECKHCKNTKQFGL